MEALAFSGGGAGGGRDLLARRSLTGALEDAAQQTIVVVAEAIAEYIAERIGMEVADLLSKWLDRYPDFRFDRTKLVLQGLGRGNALALVGRELAKAILADGLHIANRKLVGLKPPSSTTLTVLANAPCVLPKEDAERVFAALWSGDASKTRATLCAAGKPEVPLDGPAARNALALLVSLQPQAHEFLPNIDRLNKPIEALSEVLEDYLAALLVGGSETDDRLAISRLAQVVREKWRDSSPGSTFNEVAGPMGVLSIVLGVAAQCYAEDGCDARAVQDRLRNADRFLQVGNWDASVRDWVQAWKGSASFAHSVQKALGVGAFSRADRALAVADVVLEASRVMSCELES